MEALASIPGPAAIATAVPPLDIHHPVVRRFAVFAGDEPAAIRPAPIDMDPVDEFVLAAGVNRIVPERIAIYTEAQRDACRQCRRCEAVPLAASPGHWLCVQPATSAGPGCGRPD